MSELMLWPEPPKKVANRYEYGSLVFWAEGGGIYILDQNPKPGERALKPVMLPGWQQRYVAIMQLLQHMEKKSHQGNPQQIRMNAQECHAYRELLRAMYDVGCQAVQQGDLSRPDVQRYYREHVATVKQTHLVPGVILPH